MIGVMSDEERRLEFLETELGRSVDEADMYLRKLDAEIRAWEPAVYPESDFFKRHLLAHYAKVRVAIDLAKDLVSRDPGVVQ